MRMVKDGPFFKPVTIACLPNAPLFAGLPVSAFVCLQMRWNVRQNVFYFVLSNLEWLSALVLMNRNSDFFQFIFCMVKP